MELRNTTLDDLSSLVGFSATVRLAMFFGNRDMYLPQKATETAVIAQLVGISAMRRLVDEFGPGKISVPSLDGVVIDARNAEMLSAMRLGATDVDAAMTAGITPRRALQIRKEFMAMGMLEKAQQKGRSKSQAKR